MRLELKGICCSYGDQEAVKDAGLEVGDGEFVGLIGPNGSGKSTLLKTVYRALKPDRGSLRLDGKDILSMSYRASASKIAAVGQENELPFEFTVREVVLMGRSPYKRIFDTDTKEDQELVDKALSFLGLSEKADVSFLELSGGEKQRAIIARALVQQPELMVLDEAANHLDISYQIRLFELLKERKLSVLAAMHDLNMAAMYCDRIYVMKDGRIRASGTPKEVLTEDMIHEIYGVRSLVRQGEPDGRVEISFLSGKN